jgi:hypothetical protein
MLIINHILCTSSFTLSIVYPVQSFLMDSSFESCCLACGQYFTIGVHPQLDKNCGQLRRSRRTSCKPFATLKVEPVSNNGLCSDCLHAVESVAVVFAIDDDDNSNNSSARSTTNEADNNIITKHNSLSVSSKHDNSQLNCTEQQHEIFYDLNDFTTSISGGGPVASRIVSPESSKIQSINGSSKICLTCRVRTVPKEYMMYCNICYGLSSKGINLNASGTPFEKNATTGRCRLCSGVVSNSSHQYCLKCYSAKQRDDAKRIKTELFKKQFKKQPLQPPVQHIPYICSDCGNIIHDCSWKTKCPPCFALVRASLQRKPKLIKPPVKRQFQGKPKYRS